MEQAIVYVLALVGTCALMGLLAEGITSFVMNYLRYRRFRRAQKEAQR